MGAHDDALRTLDEAERLTVVREPIDRFRAHNARGNALCSLGAYDRARDEYASSLVLARELDNVELEVHALVNQGNAAFMLGAYADALATQREGYALADRHGLRRHALIARAATAHSALYCGDLTEALAACRSIAAARSIAPLTQAFACAVTLRLRGLLGAAAVPEIDDVAAVETALALRESQIVAAVTGAAARSALERGDVDRARDFARRGMAAITEPDHAYWLCNVVAEILDGDDVAKARRLLELAAAASRNPLAVAMRDLFDARRGLRAGDALARAGAAAAAERLHALGARVEAALAREAAGDAVRASETWREIGAAEALRRLAGAPAAPEGANAALTQREAQVAALAARGYLNPGDRGGTGHRAAHRRVAPRNRLSQARRQIALRTGCNLTRASVSACTSP